ncbi:MAG: phosphoribosylanthranilate isomerase, partial [Halioglobus sp.]|nr:phosphoribosylanthranilate isomerase [Halioglobus sp.]
MAYTRIKICGITREQDARLAVAAGADAIGMVFYPPSPRAVSVEQAVAIAATVPPFVSLVGLFVNLAAQDVARILEHVPLGLLQFHGDESPGFCRAFHRPWIKSVRMKEGTDLLEVARRYSDAGGLLL